MESFDQLGLDERILQALHAEGYQSPTPVQAQAIPSLLDGQDVLGIAQTGTGKTAAFVLPILHQLVQSTAVKPRPIRALMLTPTRELAAQIESRLRVYGRELPLFSTVIFGGVGQAAQVKALRRGVDVLVATPGRLLDLYDQGFINLQSVTHFVLDEADRMLDMGFSNDVDRILALMPSKRQNMLFSATMPAEIGQLAAAMLHAPVRIEVNPESPTVERVEQYVAFVQKADKKQLLHDILDVQMVACGMVFTRTRHGASRLAKQLNQSGIPADAIHGDKSQTARTKALESFKNGDIFILVATDIASRGIDVDDITHVFNYDLPNEPEVYIHRIGRTARAGKAGIAYSFCDETESGYLVGIQQLLGYELEVLDQQPYHYPKAMPTPDQKPRRAKGPSSSQHSKRGTGRGNAMRRYDRGGVKRDEAQQKASYRERRDEGEQSQRSHSSRHPRRPPKTRSNASQEGGRGAPSSSRPRPQGQNNRGPRPQGQNNRGPRPQGQNDRGPRPQGKDNRGSRPQGQNNRGPRPQGQNNRGPRPQGQNNRGSRPPNRGRR